jgi:putative SOS response-associated peptidase YedK
MSPGEMCPIIVSAKHFDKNSEASKRVLIPALWGLLPRWHKGDYRKHGLTTNNARMETIETSKLYKPVLNSGKRCILPVEGFYEWQTVNPKLKSSERKVYFVYMPQDTNVKIEDKSTWKTVNLMYVAGLFDVWHDDHGDSLYSFTVITYESNKHFDWLHHRTPAILETKQQIASWLNFEQTPPELALKLIRHPRTMVWHQVSNYVNNSRNKSEQCNKPKAETAKNNSLMSWITKKRKSEPESPENSSKRQK